MFLKMVRKFYYFYIVNLGYYKYFGTDSRLMLPYNKINLYQNIGQLALFALYWGYTIFAVRMFLLKKEFFVEIYSINCDSTAD